MLSDLRFAIRGLRKHPGHAAAAILTLALGIGCTTAIFSVIEAVLLRTLPVPNADRLVALWEDQPNTKGASLSAPDFRDIKAQARSYENVSAYLGNAFRLTGIERPERWSVPKPTPISLPFSALRRSRPGVWTGKRWRGRIVGTPVAP